VDELHAAVAVLDDGGAAVHPVPAIEVGDAVLLADNGRVDVTADHAVHAALARVVQERVLEIEDEADRALHLALGVARQRPVARHA
jgi:hypothetical protein